MMKPLLIVTIIVAISLPPVVRILHRLGFSGWWAIIGVISPINIIALWVLAYVNWPEVSRQPSN